MTMTDDYDNVNVDADTDVDDYDDIVVAYLR
jgi:hypothetical protein